MPIKRIDKKRLSDLCAVLSEIKEPKIIEAFLYDICTPQELAELANRWHIAQELFADKKSYRTIATETEVSVTTVTRVARFLHEEKYGGYRHALKIKADH